MKQIVIYVYWNGEPEKKNIRDWQNYKLKNIYAHWRHLSVRLELFYTVWSLVMVRNQLLAKEVNNQLKQTFIKSYKVFIKSCYTLTLINSHCYSFSLSNIFVNLHIIYLFNLHRVNHIAGIGSDKYAVSITRLIFVCSRVSREWFGWPRSISHK